MFGKVFIYVSIVLKLQRLSYKRMKDGVCLSLNPHKFTEVEIFAKYHQNVSFIKDKTTSNNKPIVSLSLNPHKITQVEIFAKYHQNISFIKDKTTSR